MNITMPYKTRIS